MLLENAAYVATIVAAVVAVLSYRHARQKRELTQALGRPAKKPAQRDQPAAIGAAPLTFRESTRIDAIPSTLFSDVGHFLAVDVSPDGGLVAAINTGRRRARIFSAKGGKTGYVLPKTWLPMVEYADRERLLFHPQYSRSFLLAYVRQGASVSMYQQSIGGGYSRVYELGYDESHADCLLGASSWSPDGRHFGVGTSCATRHETGTSRAFTVWDCASAAIVSRHWIEGSTEGRLSTWHPRGDFVYVDHDGGGAIVDVRRGGVRELRDTGVAASATADVAWHPEQPILLYTATNGIAFVDADTGEVGNIINDVKSGAAPIERCNRIGRPADFRYENYSALRIAISPDGKRLASADCWGNVIVRTMADNEIERLYRVNNVEGIRTTKLYWLPCDEAGLVMQRRDEQGKLQTSFVDATTEQLPGSLAPLAEGSYAWGRERGLAVYDKDRIVVYDYV